MIFLYFCLLILKSLSQMAFYFFNLILQTAYNGVLVEENGKITYDGTTVEYKMLLDCSDIPACGNVYEITGITRDGA